MLPQETPHAITSANGTRAAIRRARTRTAPSDFDVARIRTRTDPPENLAPPQNGGRRSSIAFPAAERYAGRCKTPTNRRAWRVVRSSPRAFAFAAPSPYGRRSVEVPMPVKSIVFALCLVVAACSGGLYDFDDGGSSGGNVKVEGTLAGIDVNDTDRDIVVFVYTGICETDKADPDLCANLLLPEDLPKLKDRDYKHRVKEVVKSDALGEFFKVKDVKKGNLTIAYLQDKAKDADRRIDEEDITITRDAMNNIIPAADNAVSMHANDGRLDDVEKKATVELDNVALDFPAAAAAGSSAPSTTSTSSTSITFTTMTMPNSTTTSLVTTTTTTPAT
jgi:hypothetical protein